MKAKYIKKIRYTTYFISLFLFGLVFGYLVGSRNYISCVNELDYCRSSNQCDDYINLGECEINMNSIYFKGACSFFPYVLDYVSSNQSDYQLIHLKNEVRNENEI